MRNILPSSADQRALSRTPGARSIIPGSHFHCPLLLTHQKNLGPIKGWRGHQPAKQAIFLHFTLLLPSTAHFLFPSYYPFTLFHFILSIELSSILPTFNPTSHHCLVSAWHCVPFSSPIITVLSFPFNFYSPFPHSYELDKCHLVKKNPAGSCSLKVTQLCCAGT